MQQEQMEFSSCDRLNFMNFSISLPWQLQSLLQLQYCANPLGFFNPIHIYILPYSSCMLHPPDPRNEPLYCFVRSSQCYCTVLIKFLKHYNSCTVYSLPKSVSDSSAYSDPHDNEVCQYQLTTKPVEILMCGPPSSLAKVLTGKHSKITYKWRRDITPTRTTCSTSNILVPKIL